MADTVLIEPHYFPSIPCFQAIYKANTLILAGEGHYQKQSYQNRCYLSSPQGFQKLIIPVVHKSYNNPYANVSIAYETPWVRQHLRTLATLYGQTPYYTFVADIITPLLISKPRYLYDLNSALIKACFALLQKPIEIITPHNHAQELPANTLTLSYHYHPKKQGLTPSDRCSIIDLLCKQGPYAHQYLATR